MFNYFGPVSLSEAALRLRTGLTAVGLELAAELPRGEDRLYLVWPPAAITQKALDLEPEVTVYWPHHLLLRPRPGATLCLTPRPARLWASFFNPELESLAAIFESALQTALGHLQLEEATALLGDYIARYGPCRPNDGSC